MDFGPVVGGTEGTYPSPVRGFDKIYHHCLGTYRLCTHLPLVGINEENPKCSVEQVVRLVEGAKNVVWRKGQHLDRQLPYSCLFLVFENLCCHCHCQS